MSQEQKAVAFKRLHEREGGFLVPNPWDIGSARLLVALGFEALATTSYGFANSLGRVDGSVTLDEAVDHCRAMSQAVDVPVSADFENAFADDPEGAARNILRVAGTGLAGCSIEDSTGDAEHPIYDFNQAVERVAAAVEAVRSLGFPFVLTARAENQLHGVADLDDTIRRLQAFEAAGADVLYAPGLRTLEEVGTVKGAVTKPLNVLAPPLGGVSLAQLVEAGATRISIGGALSRAAWSALVRAGREMRAQGTFGWLSELEPAGEINAAFRRAPNPS